MAQSDIDKIYAEEAIIDNAEITKESVRQPDFTTLVIVFLVGALSFAVALSYNNFAQAIISHYSFGSDGIKATFYNLIIFTVVALGILYMAWRSNPKVVGDAVV